MNLKKKFINKTRCLFRDFLIYAQMTINLLAQVKNQLFYL